MRKESKYKVYSVEIGNRIRKMRVDRDITPEELAEKLEISTNHLGRVERGEVFQTQDIILDCSRILDVSIDYFYQDIPDMSEASLKRSLEDELKGLTPEQLKIFLAIVPGIRKLSF